MEEEGESVENNNNNNSFTLSDEEWESGRRTEFRDSKFGTPMGVEVRSWYDLREDRNSKKCYACGKGIEDHSEAKWVGCDRCERWFEDSCLEKDVVVEGYWQCRICSISERG